MDCCHFQGAEEIFDDKLARRDLKRYRRKGADKHARLLVEALTAEGVQGMTLLDIGGGVGAVHHELLQAGASSATDVDASSAYLAAASEEAERQGHAGRINYHHGDFVEVAPELDSADIVTLDRVLCCYPDWESLVGLSSARARRLFGVVYPRGRWWVRMGLAFGNFMLWLGRNPFRTFVHPPEEVEARLLASGFVRRYYRAVGLVWQVVVYARGGAS